MYSLINSVNDSLTVTNTKLNPHKAQLSFDVSSVKVLFECANIFYKSLNMLLRRKEIASGGAGVERARATGSAVARVFNRPLSLINKKQLSKTLKISRTHPRSVQRELHLSNCSSSSVNPRVRLARAWANPPQHKLISDQWRVEKLKGSIVSLPFVPHVPLFPAAECRARVGSDPLPGALRDVTAAPAGGMFTTAECAREINIG